jgi:hypothetical protein
LIVDGVAENAIVATHSTFAGVVTAVDTQSLLVRVLDAVALLPFWSFGVVALIPVAATHVQRQTVLFEKLTVTVWLVPLVMLSPRKMKLVRVPSLTAAICVHVPPAPDTLTLPPPDVVEPRTIAVSPVPGVRLCVPLVVPLIRLLVGVFATTGRPINYLAC